MNIFENICLQSFGNIEHLKISILYSLGLRPNAGWSNGQSVLFSIVPGNPPAQKLRIVEYLESLFRPFGAPRLDFLDLLVHREAFKNDAFVASYQNVKNQRVSRTWEAQAAILDPKTSAAPAGCTAC